MIGINPYHKELSFKLAEGSLLIILRYELTDNIEKLKLHGFAHASGKASGVAIYIKYFSTNG